jgi:hypothetical protein
MRSRALASAQPLRDLFNHREESGDRIDDEMRTVVIAGVFLLRQ